MRTGFVKKNAIWFLEYSYTSTRNLVENCLILHILLFMFGKFLVYVWSRSVKVWTKRILYLFIGGQTHVDTNEIGPQWTDIEYSSFKPPHQLWTYTKTYQTWIVWYAKQPTLDQILSWIIWHLYWKEKEEEKLHNGRNWIYLICGVVNIRYIVLYPSHIYPHADSKIAGLVIASK